MENFPGCYTVSWNTVVVMQAGSRGVRVWNRIICAQMTDIELQRPSAEHVSIINTQRKEHRWVTRCMCACVYKNTALRSPKTIPRWYPEPVCLFEKACGESRSVLVLAKGQLAGEGLAERIETLSRAHEYVGWPQPWICVSNVFWNQITVSRSHLDSVRAGRFGYPR